MIIERIKVENLATYKQATFDFTQADKTLAVYGSTGAGKTTFFVDAITFGLFGRVYGQANRKFTKYILSPTAPKCSVEIEFKIGNKKYRLRRTINRSGFRQNAKIDTEAKLTEIDEKGREKVYAFGAENVTNEIIKLTKFDFKTFLYTIVVRQGEVANIIGKDIEPSERRKIFLKAFGVDYSKHKEKAEQQLKRVRYELSELKGRRDSLKQEISKKSQLEQELAEAEKRYELLSSVVEELSKKRGEIERELAQLNEKISQIGSKIEAARAELERIENLKRDLERLNAKKKELLKIVSNEELLSNNLSRAEEERYRLSLLRQNLVTYKDLLSRKRELESRIEEIETLLVEEEELIKQREDISSKIALIDKLKKEVSELERILRNLKEEKGKKEGRIEYIERSLRELESPDVTACPTCGTELTPERKDDVLNMLTIEEEKAREEVESLKAQIREVEHELGEKKKLKEEYEELRNRFVRIENQLENIDKAKNELQLKLLELEKVSSQLSDYEEVCKKTGIDIPDDRAIAVVERKLKQIESQIEEFRRELINVQRSKGQLEEIEQNISKVEADIREISAKVDEEKLKRLQKELDELVSDRSSLETKRQILDSELVEKYRERGRFEQKIRQCREGLQEIKRKEEELSEINRKIEEFTKKEKAYELLYREVFHERGFPVFLLKEILKDVEMYARGYLEDFLKGKSLELSVDKGGNITINVRSDGYARDLVTYSGGESVLIGFALRLAIAKALVESKLAAPPKFLIIDEGFGPLSAEYRRAVLETLNKLREHYERIIVISHIEDITEDPFFGTKVKVIKDEEGYSHLKVM